MDNEIPSLDARLDASNCVAGAGRPEEIPGALHSVVRPLNMIKQ